MVVRDVQSQQSVSVDTHGHCTGAVMGNLHGCHFPIRLLNAEMQVDDRGFAAVYSLLGIHFSKFMNN